jgi:hypothetical protein
MSARFRSRRSLATTARRSGNPRHGAGVSAPITALGRSSGGGAGLVSTGVAGVVTGSALRELPTAAGGPPRAGSAAHSAAARPLSPAAGGRPVALLPGRCTLMEHLWLPGIVLLAPEPSVRRRRPGGLGRERRLHGIWRTADAARQLRWGAQNGAGAERHAEAVDVRRHIRLAAAAIHPDPSKPASTTNPLDSPVTPPPTIRTGCGSLPARSSLLAGKRLHTPSRGTGVGSGCGTGS